MSSTGHGPTRWTRPTDVLERVQRAWKRGDLLRAHAERTAFPTIEVPLRGPSAADLAEHLTESRSWAADIVRAADDGRKFRVITGTVGGKHLGRSELPVRVHIEEFSQAWRLLGVRNDVARFDEVLRLSVHVPTARAWALAHPLKAISLADEWPAILAARDWLDWNRGSGHYVRQIDAPGVDTKLIERHRGLLAQWLDVSGTASGFLSALGLAAKPGTVRLRFDPALLNLSHSLTEATFRLDELRSLELTVSCALIVENEISYLSVPVPAGGVVLWGRGYDADSPASVNWLAEVAARGDAFYWGDLDTHGFSILNRVRSHLPGVRSVLMDRETLLAHESRWGYEPTPTNAALSHLTATESSLYSDLVTGRHGTNIRLEQERIDWAWVTRRLEAEL